MVLSNETEKGSVWTWQRILTDGYDGEGGLAFVPFRILCDLRNYKPDGVQVLYDLWDAVASASCIRGNRHLPGVLLQKLSFRTPLRQMRLDSSGFILLTCNLPPQLVSLLFPFRNRSTHNK